MYDSSKGARNKKIFIIMLILGGLGIFAAIIDSIKNPSWERKMEQERIKFETIQRERENAIQRQENIALNPLRVRSINLVCSRLSATELLKILIKYETRNAYDSFERDSRNNSLRFDISHVLNWNHNINFSNAIAGYIVGEDIYFQMPDETTVRKVSVSLDEIIYWVVGNIYNRKRDLQNIPANERDRSYLLYEMNENGGIEYRIISR